MTFNSAARNRGDAPGRPRQPSLRACIVALGMVLSGGLLVWLAFTGDLHGYAIVGTALVLGFVLSMAGVWSRVSGDDQHATRLVGELSAVARDAGVALVIGAVVGLVLVPIEQARSDKEQEREDARVERDQNREDARNLQETRRDNIRFVREVAIQGDPPSKPFSGLDLRGAHLPGLDLAGANLADTDLTGADLTGTHLDDTNMQNADLSEANVASVDFTHSILLGADLSQVDIHDRNSEAPGFTRIGDVNFSECDLSLANFTGAQLDYADMSDTLMREADLTDANFSHADFTNSRLDYANLTGADLSDADLSGASLSGTVLTGANLNGANLANADLLGADLSDANLKGISDNALTQWPPGFP